MLVMTILYVIWFIPVTTTYLISMFIDFDRRFYNEADWRYIIGLRLTGFERNSDFVGRMNRFFKSDDYKQLSPLMKLNVILLTRTVIDVEATYYSYGVTNHVFNREYSDFITALSIIEFVVRGIPRLVIELPLFLVIKLFKCRPKSIDRYIHNKKENLVRSAVHKAAVELYEESSNE